MKSVDLGFVVSEAVLQSCVSGGGENLDWMELQMHAPEDQVLCDECGQTLEIDQWQMIVRRARDASQSDEAGLISCSTSTGGNFMAKVWMSGPQFDRLLQSVVAGGRIQYVSLSVLGLKESSSTLIWRRAGEIDLPVQMAGIRTVLYALKNDANATARVR